MRVLVVDDSALMRRWLTECFGTEQGIECQTARDGVDALAKIRSFDPDVITLDVNMPAMDGITCLSRIMTEVPRPVVMLSSLTEKGALVTLEALELGAVDFIAKPDGTVSHELKSIFPEIIAKVRTAANARTRRPRIGGAPGEGASRAGSYHAAAPSRQLRPRGHRLAPRAMATAAAAALGRATELVLIGASTGGPRALEDVLLPLDASFPCPIVIAQHMPRRFTSVFAQRLSNMGAIEVTEVTSATELRAGRAYIAQGDADIVISRRSGRLVASSVPADKARTWNPSVDRMVESALQAVPPERLIGVLLTGMGNDGATSMTRLRAAGGRTIAESEASAAIYGMPRELVLAGGAEKVLESERIAAMLRTLVISGSA